MITLALESAAAVASVALTEDGRTLAELTLDNGNTHSETLLPMADMLFRLTGRTLADVDLFAVSVGPGSFTGIRIGAATVKGLAFGSGKCCLGVSSLEALAYGLRGQDGLICPVLNARRRQVYTALFRSDGGRITTMKSARSTGWTSALRAMQNPSSLSGTLPALQPMPSHTRSERLPRRCCGLLRRRWHMRQRRHMRAAHVGRTQRSPPFISAPVRRNANGWNV